MNQLRFLRIAYILFVFCVVTVIVAPAQTLTTLHNFAGYPSDGANPYAGLIQARDGNFYGTTTVGGANGGCALGTCGTIFKITPSGALTTLHSFNGSDGEVPDGGLVQATDGRFYGTTFYGGTGYQGTVFKIAANGTLTVLYNFGNNLDDPALPYDGLIQATDGNFYGTTSIGGTGSFHAGAVVKIAPNGTLTTLYGFGITDGADPVGGLVQASDGNFYGTTSQDGGNCADCGTVFKITPSGTLTTLHYFHGADGSSPQGALIQTTDGNFYGTTAGGGANSHGTVFKITPSGTLTTLYSFCPVSGCADGFGPQAGLVQADDGNFYGTTKYGGDENCPLRGGCGTVFKITPAGALTTLYTFVGSDGAWPDAGLIQATNGAFYGTTYTGGANGDGTVFRIQLAGRVCATCRP